MKRRWRKKRVTSEVQAKRQQVEGGGSVRRTRLKVSLADSLVRPRMRVCACVCACVCVSRGSLKMAGM